MEIEQYKRSILAACDLYQSEVKKASKQIHPARIKDIIAFQELVKAIEDKPLLDLKLNEHLTKMTTRGKIWTLYLFSTGNSRLKLLVSSILSYYHEHDEVMFLKKTIMHYEVELEKRQKQYDIDVKKLLDGRDHALASQKKDYEACIGRLQSQIEFLVQENSSLKQMVQQQTNIIHEQLDQIMSLTINESDEQQIKGAQVKISEEYQEMKAFSVFG